MNTYYVPGAKLGTVNMEMPSKSSEFMLKMVSEPAIFNEDSLMNSCDTDFLLVPCLPLPKVIPKISTMHGG